MKTQQSQYTTPENAELHPELHLTSEDFKLVGANFQEQIPDQPDVKRTNRNFPFFSAAVLCILVLACFFPLPLSITTPHNFILQTSTLPPTMNFGLVRIPLDGIFFPCFGTAEGHLFL